MRKLFLPVASAVLFVALVRAQEVRLVSVDGRRMRVSTAGLHHAAARGAR